MEKFKTLESNYFSKEDKKLLNSLFKDFNVKINKKTNSITLTDLPFDIKKSKDLEERIKLAILPDLAEENALELAEQYFGIPFKKGSYNKKGFDIVSIFPHPKLGIIKIEVKQTSCLGTKSHLSIGSVYQKEGEFTHLMIYDLYSPKIRKGNPLVSLIEHDDFFNPNLSLFHGKTKLWRWDYKYENNAPLNTSLFLKNLISK
jgi:hypothetical protein